MSSKTSVAVLSATLHGPAMTPEIGKRIRIAREARGLTQAQVATAMGVSRVTVTQWEIGKHVPKGHRWKVLADLLGLSADDLLDTPGDAGVREVPLIQSISAGPWAELETVERLSDLPRIRAASLPPGVFVAARVDGESMNRIAPHGSIVFVDLSERTLVDRGIYIFETDVGATLKRYRDAPPRLTADSTDPGFEDIFPRGPVKAIGRVRRVLFDI